ncbi:MAG: acyl-CoA dehydrogenase [Crocinitomicaceae bacterium]|nr:acyl-CoA dehydrogenase [Crocinitomicaceae bacterium]|tara:strand:- start:10044 stop:11828 length:1785 start_codon:yes stop_codon:yes gene_type:complete
MSDKQPITGGDFLIKEVACEDIFTPEEWTEEHIMMRQTSIDFVNSRVVPNLEAIDDMQEGLMPSLIEEAGELGLLASSVPKEYGGMGMDFKSSMIITEGVGGGHSFAVSFTAHTGIATLPILYYGNDEQKKKYIPGLASGKLKGCYCLTEPSSGSDANSAKSKAVLSEDGKHYILNGQKMWITNGGFADLLVVFAKIDEDENLSAFILERDYEGITMNPEEKKMGIKGSSTRQVFFNDVKVPIENLLSKRQNGFKIAVNILNIGRIKLGGVVLGSAKDGVSYATNYANEREQFGRPISKYGAIRQKLGEMAIQTYALESAVYRATQNIEDAIKDLEDGGMNHADATLKGIASFAPECAMMKVLGSEVVDYIADEAVQILGGMGYSAETRAERSYRDARINRIFEGTNEINRMLTVDMILKKAMKGEIDLMTPAMEVANEIMGIPDFNPPSDDIFERHLDYIKKFKKAVLMVAGSAAQKLMMSLAKEQEILMGIADMTIWTYTAESIVLRVQKLHKSQGAEAAALPIEVMQTYIHSAADKINVSGRDALMGFAEGDELKMMLMGMKRFTKVEPFNCKESRRKIAQACIDKNEYCF